MNLLLLSAAPAHARPGDLDRTFNGDGKAAYKVWAPGGGTVRSMALLDGRRPLLSVFSSRNGTYAPTLLRLTIRGRLADKTQLPAPLIRPPLFAFGYALTDGLGGEYQLARIGSTRAVTLKYGGDVIGFRVDRKGRVILLNWVEAARFLPDGRLDTSYGDGGTARLTGISEAAAALITRDGRVYASGGRHLLVLDARGRKDRSVDQGLVSVPGARFPRVTAMAEGPGGTVLLAGWTWFNDAWVARRLRDGKPDRRFGKRGFVAGARVLQELEPAAIVRDRRGRLVLAGAQPYAEQPWQVAVLRVSRSGQVDRSFGRRGRKAFMLGVVRGIDTAGSRVSALAVDDRGRIVVAGQVYDDDAMLREDLGTPYPAIARLRG